MDADKLSLSGDFHVISREPGKKNISIVQIRDFIKILEMSSFANSYKVGIIREAETLSPEAANALLKLLEEPQEKVIIILITAQVEAIIKTIVSRSQVLNFYPVPTAVIHDYLIKERGASPSLAKRYAHLALGRPALAVKFFLEPEFYQDYAAKVEVFLNFFQDDLVKRLQAVGALLSNKKDEGEPVKAVAQILEVWIGLARDLLLINLDQVDLIQNLEAQATLKNITSVSAEKIIKLLETGQKYLAANVSPKNVLENIAINIVE